MNLEQMRAWLTIEGWRYLPTDKDLNLCPAIYDGHRYLVWDGGDPDSEESEAIYDHNQPRAEWLTNPKAWDDTPDEQVILFYNHLAGDSHE